MSTQTLTWRRLVGWLGVLCVCEVCAALLGVGFGSSGLGPERLLDVWLGDVPLTTTEWSILRLARLPRVCFAAIVGGALAMSGVVFQALLRNPLADPYILGVSGGGALAATLYLVCAASLGMSVVAIGLPAAALCGAGLSVVALLGAARWMKAGKMSVYVMLLLGVIFNAFASAIITLLKAIVSAQKAQELLFYLMGTLAVEGMAWSTILAAAVAVGLSMLGLWSMSNELNIMALGDEAALGLGVRVERVRTLCVVCASVAVAVAVAYTGLIGFVGLVVPHGLRLWLGPDHRLLIPASVLGGAICLTLSDVLARGLFEWFSMTLPVGVVTSLIGAPLFMVLLRKSLSARSRGGVA